jgi:hypothetical protein
VILARRDRFARGVVTATLERSSVIVPGEAVPNEICSRCGVRRTGSFRYCRSCAFDFEASPAESGAGASPVSAPAAVEPPPVVPPPVLMPTIVASGPSVPPLTSAVPPASAVPAAPFVTPAAGPQAAPEPAEVLGPLAAPRPDDAPAAGASTLTRTITRLPAATRARAVLSMVAIGLASVLVIGALASRVGTVAPSAAAGQEVATPVPPTASAASTPPTVPPSGAVAGAVSQVIVVDDPVQVVADRPVGFEGEAAIYTWRSVSFAGVSTTLRWTIVAPIDDHCRLDWRIKPADASAVQGIGTAAPGEREDGLVAYESAFGTGTLTVVSDCASWTITLQAI